jgi:hypothetical protein
MEEKVIRPLKLPFLMIFAFAASGFSSANDIYLAQRGKGRDTGQDCADAKVYTYFNSDGNWVESNPTGTQIGPGTTIHLCGSITGSAGSTMLSFQGAGRSGNPITLLFGSGASLQAAYFNSNGAININGDSYITINGGANGFIQATSNGTSGSSSCPSGRCRYQHNSQGIENFGSNVTVEDLGVYDMYVHTSTSDEAFDSLSVDCIDVGSSSTAPSNISISGNTMHDCYTGVQYWYGVAGGSNFTASNNTIYNICWGMAWIEGGAVTFNDVFLFGNKVYGHANWADNSQACHGNGIHLFPQSRSNLGDS